MHMPDFLYYVRRQGFWCMEFFFLIHLLEISLGIDNNYKGISAQAKRKQRKNEGTRTTEKVNRNANIHRRTIG